MPRRARGPTNTCAYHLFNRAVRRATLFENDAEFADFEDLLLQNLQRQPHRLLAYSAMRTHWHLVVWPQPEADLPRFMQRLTMQHAQHWHRQRGTEGTGHVYQDRYKSVAIEGDEHLLTALRYVERNALSAGIVARAEEWRWCSLWRRHHHCERPLLSDWPLPIPTEWVELLNRS